MFKKDPHSFDLVMTDLFMPELNGKELVRSLLDIRGDLSIIVYSGSINSLDLLKNEQLPVREYLQKPVSAGQLKDAVEKILRQDGFTFRRKILMIDDYNERAEDSDH